MRLLLLYFSIFIINVYHKDLCLGLIYSLKHHARFYSLTLVLISLLYLLL